MTIVHFDEAERLAERAIAQGLFLGDDKWGNYYLSLPQDEIDRRNREFEEQNPGRRCVNPYFVLCRVTLPEVRAYLDQHPSPPYRILEPMEVLPKFGNFGAT